MDAIERNLNEIFIKLEEPIPPQYLCDYLSRVLLFNFVDEKAITKMIKLWNNTFFHDENYTVISLARGKDYLQTCIIFLSDNLYHYTSLIECNKFSSDDRFTKGNLCKAIIGFIKDNKTLIENEINDCELNKSFPKKEKEKLVNTIHCLIDILNDDESSFKKNIQYALMIDKQYRRGTTIKHALIATTLLRLARHKNRNWTFDNKLIHQFLVNRAFYTQEPKAWSKNYFKDELSQIINLIK